MNFEYNISIVLTGFFFSTSLSSNTRVRTNIIYAANGDTVNERITQQWCLTNEIMYCKKKKGKSNNII